MQTLGLRTPAMMRSTSGKGDVVARSYGVVSFGPHCSRHLANKSSNLNRLPGLVNTTPRTAKSTLQRTQNKRHVPTCQAAPSGTSSATADESSATTAAYSKLQNGSDIRGVALDINPNEPVTLTPAKMFFIGASFAEWLAKQRNVPLTSLKVSVGADPRLSSPMMSSSLLAGLASKGVTVAQFGIATTPAMFMSCVMEGYNYDGAVMVTASHLPVNRNGAKFFTAAGGLGKPDIKVILQRAGEMAIAESVHAADKYGDPAFVVASSLKIAPSLITGFNYLEVYAAHLRDIVKRGVAHPTTPDTPLTGFKVVVNAGNGAGGFFAEQVLGPLGADISGSIYLNPDGSFPNHPPNPEDKAAVKATTEAVLSSGADFGIMLDTDVDRSGVVDSHGIAINRNRYIALMASIALRENPNETIVTDSCTSNGLATFITQLGGQHFRYKKGYKNIIDKGIELNESGTPCPLMMETSGHGAMRENYFLDDGAYSALKIVIEAVRRRLAGQGEISEMLNELREPVEAMEIRVKIKAADIAAEGAKITAAFKKWMDEGAGGNARWVLEEENYEGWRVKVDEGDGKEGWILVRPSLHDPDVVMNVESEINGGMREILLHFLEFFRAHPDDFDVCTGLVEDYVYNPNTPGAKK